MPQKTISLEELCEMGASYNLMLYFLRNFGEEISIKAVVQRLHYWQKDSSLGKEAEDWEAWLLYRDAELTEAMLQNGANVHIKNDLALALAVVKNDAELVKVLKAHGALYRPINLILKPPKR